MEYLDFNKPIKYISSSLRFFSEHEHHIKRHMKEDVLLLVYKGVLRFSEDGVDYEIIPGHYHIQKHNTFQDGIKESDSPSYFYVHFLGEWNESDGLPKNGEFSFLSVKENIDKLDDLELNGASELEKTTEFYQILCKLSSLQKVHRTIEDDIADYLKINFNKKITLEILCQEFHFSKNHIINIFNKKYGNTPFDYLSTIRIRNAERMLEATSDTAEIIGYKCGFQNYSQFYKVFKKMNSVSPKEWRNNKRLAK